MRLLLILLPFLTPLAFGEDKPTGLPVAWHGTWTGTMVIAGPGGKRTEVPVALRIEPIRDSRDLVWVTTCGEGQKRVVKDYRLVPDADRPDLFRTDERNGIVLENRLVGQVMYSVFEVGGSVLTARYELRGDKLRFDVTSATALKEKTGKGQVQDYRVDAVQSAELTRE